MTNINDEWTEIVGRGKRFETLEELLTQLKETKRQFGPNCGFAGGPIDEEIHIIEEMIKNQIPDEDISLKLYWAK